MRAALAIAGVVFIAGAVYLLWPLDAVHAWQPSAAIVTAPALIHPRALDDVQRIARDADRAPIALAVEPAGSIYADTVVAAYVGGNVLRVSADGLHHLSLGNTRGRPRAVALTAAGAIYIADADRGLLAFTQSAGFQTLEDTTNIAGVSVAPSGGEVYFTRVSAHFSWRERRQMRFAHDTSGRLLAYDPKSRRVYTIARDLAAPRGVALGPNGDYALVVEADAYRIVRVWLKGAQAGKTEVFADGLPGFADGITFNGTNRFWVAIPTPRIPALDALAERSTYRRFLLRLPVNFLPRFHVLHQGVVIAFDLDGQRVAELRGSGAAPYAPVSYAAESGPWLWLGSDQRKSIGRIALQTVLPTAPAPPAS